MQAGLVALRKDWGVWITIALAVSIAVTVVYLLAVAANDVAFNYSFWYGGAPTSTASKAAVATDWFLLLVAVTAGMVGFGWMCRFELGGSTIGGSLRDAVAGGLRTCWATIPLFVIGLAGFVSVVLAPLVVLFLAVLPLARLDKTSRDHGPWRVIKRSVRPLSSIGGVVTMSAFGCLVAGIRVERGVATLRGSAEAVAAAAAAAAALIVLAGLLASIAGWCISAVCWLWQQQPYSSDH